MAGKPPLEDNSKAQLCGISTTKRRRITNLLRSVKNQVEFFFGERNLVKDKYLLDKTGPLGTNYVSISVLESFNSIKELGANKDIIAKAIKTSNFLELDKEENCIRRKFTVRIPTNLDQSTIYVEGLPSDATIGWMKQICSKLGQTKHIYLPRFKNSGLIKGFAFIEFSQVDEAYRACDILNSPPERFFPNRTETYLTRLHQNFNSSDKKKKAIQPVSSRQPNNNNHSHLQSTTNHLAQHILKEKKAPLKEPRSNNNSEESGDGKAIKSNKGDGGKLHDSTEGGELSGSELSINGLSRRRRRKRCASEPAFAPHNTDKVPSKVRRTTIRENSAADESDEADVKDRPTNGDDKPAALNVDMYIAQARRMAQIKQESGGSDGVGIGKCASYPDFSSLRGKPKMLSTVVAVPRKRRRRKEKRAKGKTRQEPPVLKAMTKLAWLEMKKNYLRQQRDEMGKLKSILQNTASSDANTRSAFIKRHLVLDEHASSMDEDDTLRSHQNNGQAPEKREENASKNGAKFRRNRGQAAVAFKAGVITRLLTINGDTETESKPLPGFHALRQHFSRYGEVAYVDVKDGSDSGHLRFENAESAQRAILEEQNFSICLLTGVDEERYWDGLLASRELKRSRERPKIRGRQKLAIKAIQITSKDSKQHIKFNDDFK